MQIALDLLAWMPMLVLTGKARLREPRSLRLRLFTTAGQLITTGRRRILRLARHWALDQPHHRRPRTACTPVDPRLTSRSTRSYERTLQPEQ